MWSGSIQHALCSRDRIVRIGSAIHPMIEVQDAKSEYWSIGDINQSCTQGCGRMPASRTSGVAAEIASRTSW